VGRHRRPCSRLGRAARQLIAGVETVKAIVQDKYGEADNVLRLEEIDRPEIGDDQVLACMRPASISVTGTS
jgi:hypothetical protein